MPIINKGIFSTDTVYIRQTGNDWPTAQVTTTADVVESSSNLYFTNARVFAALSNGITGNLVVSGTIFANNLVANNLVINGNELFSGEQGANLTVTKITANIWNGLYTANVIESPTNLYFTVARVNTTIRPMLTTANVVETSGNLYFTNARVLNALVNANIAGNLRVTGSITANGLTINGVEVFQSERGANITVDTITANVVYSNSFVGTGVGIPTLSSSSNIILSAGVINVNGNLVVTGRLVASDLYVNNSNIADLVTSDVREVSGNLYFTNTRVVSALVAGDNISIEANGRISASVPATANAATLNLTTADVRETSNLYFTNARVLSALTGNVTIGNLLTTGQIVSTLPGSAETGAGQIYLNGATNNRIDWAPIGTGAPTFTTRSDGTKVVLYPSLTGATTDYAIGIDAATLWTSVPEYGDSFKFKWYGATTEIASLSGIGTFTVKTIQANVWNNLYTSNVIEWPTNLYFTNTRSRQAISGSTGVIYDSSTGAISIGQNVDTTASVTFKDVFVANNLVVYGSTTTWGANNLVVSDNMIYLNNQSNNSNPDLGISFNYYDGVYHHAGFFRDASDGVFKVFDNYAPEPDANIFIDTNHNTFRLANLQATNYIGNVTGFVTGQVSSLANHDTSSLKEGSNLYFTVDRVNATVQPFLTTANVVETSGNLYFTAARVNATVQPFLTTANVIETSANLYFTNARVVSALIAGDNIAIEANGRISASVPAAANAATLNLTTADVRETSNLYFTNARVVSALVAGDNISIESNGRISANVTAALNSIANINLTIDNLTTDGIPEGTQNLYYTNSRVVSAVTPLLTAANILNFVSTVNATVQPFLTAANIANFVNTVNATVQPFLTTANVLESSSNLYFTNTRVFSAIADGSSSLYIGNTTASTSKTTGAVTVAGGLGVAGDLYAGTSLVVDSGSYGNVIITQFGSVYAQAYGLNATSLMQVKGNDGNAGIGMRAVTGSSSLIYSNAAIDFRISSRLRDLDTPAGGTNIASISLTGLTVTGNVNTTTVRATIWNGLYTANVIETDGNLYFTNARVVSALIAGDSITIEANGRISANVVGGGGGGGTIYTAGDNIDISNNVISANIIVPTTVINTTQVIQSTGATSYTLNASVSSPQNILVIVEGLIQIPTIDYTTSGTTLTLNDSPVVNSNIEIRYFGIDTINSSRSLAATIDSFIGTGANTYTVSSSPPNKNFVDIHVGNLYISPTQYTLVGKIITFNQAPVVGANIDIRVLGGTAGTSYNTRTYTANGVSNTFIITDGFNQDTLLVFENGVNQVPGIDYTVVNDTIYFATPPAANVVVQIRELGITGTSGPNVIASIRGLDQVSGNILPTIDVTKNLGSSTYKWNNSYVNQAYVSNVLILGSTTISATGSGFTLVSGNTTTTISGPTQSSRAFGLALIFGG